MSLTDHDGNWNKITDFLILFFVRYRVVNGDGPAILYPFGVVNQLIWRLN